MVNAHEDRGRLERLIQLRVLVATAVFGLGLVLQSAGFQFIPLVPFALCLLLTYAASVAYALTLPRVRDLPRFAALQAVFDVVVVTALVALTGREQSLFNFLYVLTIIAASVFVSRGASLWLAGLASVLYTGIVGVHLLGVRTALVSPGRPDLPPAFAILALAVNVTTFLAVALLSGHLAERIRKADQALAAERESLGDLQAFKTNILHSMGSGIVGVNRAWRIIVFNRAAEEITGWKAEEAVGRPWETVFGRDLDLASIPESLPVNEGRRSPRYEILLRRRDGQGLPLGFSFSPLQSGRGEWIGLIAVCQDLTEIKRMEERVRQADRLAALGRLSANMAHEIRNPLASLSGSIELLAQERGTDEARAGLTEIVLRESERLNQIIADFLAYARPTLPQRHPADLAQVLDEVLDQLARREGTTVKLRREYPSALPALVDGQQVRQAVWHLCAAAIDAMGGGGELLVGARNGDRIELWVSDTGPRIPPEELAHLFEPFASSRGGSTGLGLALVHRIVEDHGGEVEVRSRPEGGTTVLLTFPRG